MKLSLTQDICINCVLPFLAGCCLYLLFYYTNLTGFWRNHLPDGLWAYALLSGLLIIWNRQINIFWTTIIFVLFIAFEILQYFHRINGTGDLWDVIIYFLFSGIAILTNKYLHQNKP